MPKALKLQRSLPNPSVLYSSATAATDVIKLNYAEQLGFWVDSTPFPTKESFLGEISSAAVAAIEVVA